MSYVTIDENGVSASTFEEILLDLKNEYKGIYGNDVYLENDSQDGQFLALIARAISDTAAVAVGVYNSFSPVSALGEALSRNVAINGITRAIPTNSFAPVVISGAIGTTIKNGIVGDGTHRWFLPTTVIIDNTGSITVNAVCESLGAIAATPHSINKIITPTRGWVAVDNPSVAVLGNPVENDATLRQRQEISVALPSQSLIDGLWGAIAQINQVKRCRVYENYKGDSNELGIPKNSIAVVVEGGDSQEIAETIFNKKSLGCGLHGNTEITIIDRYNNPVHIKYWIPLYIDLNVKINIRVYSSYTHEIGVKIKQEILNYINNVLIGDRIVVSRLYLVASLYGLVESSSFEIINISILVNGVSYNDFYALNFNQIAVVNINNISLEVF